MTFVKPLPPAAQAHHLFTTAAPQARLRLARGYHSTACCPGWLRARAGLTAHLLARNTFAASNSGRVPSECAPKVVNFA